MKLRKTGGFTLVELLIVVAIIGIIAAIAVPGLLRARLAGNEASAIGSVRAISSSNAAYASTCANGGFAISLVTLATPAMAGKPSFMSPDLATDPTVKSGYTVVLADGAATTVITRAATTCNAVADAKSNYQATATPVTVGVTGQRSFASDNRGTIYFQADGATIAPGMPAPAAPLP